MKVEGYRRRPKMIWMYFERNVMCITGVITKIKTDRTR